MPTVPIYPNHEPLALEMQTPGCAPSMYRFHPNEIWFDSDGWVRLISVQCVDGDVGNFKLAPCHPQVHQIARAMAEAAASIIARTTYVTRGR